MRLSQAILNAAVLLVLLAPLGASAQVRSSQTWHIELGASTHVSGYCGDIGHKGSYGVFSDTQWNLVQMGGGLGARFQQSGKRLGLNFDLRRIRIQGADSMSNKVVSFVRNLHFKNEMTEWAFTADYPLLRLGGQVGAFTMVHSLRANAGIALLHHAPMAQVDRNNICYDQLIEMGYTTPGEWHDLRSMRTEGDTYAEYVATIPLGISWTLSADNGSGRPWHFTLSGLWRWTWTDRLDDIRDQYANPWEMTPLGLALSTQSNPDDMPPCAEPPSLSTFQFQQGLDLERQPIRGNITTRDMYFTIGFKAARSLTSSGIETFHKKRFRGPRVVSKR
mgnify:FL=1